MRNLVKNNSWEDDYYNDPPSIIGRRPSVNILMQPGVDESNQDNISANLHELAEIIRKDERVDELTQRIKGEFFEYGISPKWNHLPYVFQTIIHRQAKDEIPPQRYYYALIVMVGEEEYDHTVPLPDRSVAEAWRDRLFTDYSRRVRLAYVGPTNDCVYLICQGRYDGMVNIHEEWAEKEEDGGYNVSFRRRVTAEERTMVNSINNRYKDCDIHINAYSCPYCYISSDPDARWRAFIKDKRD
jgi:hypothetical protein